MKRFPGYFEKRVSASYVIRFVFSKSQYSLAKKIAKYTAFLPHQNYPSELSVYQNSLEIEKMYSIGDDYVGIYRTKSKKVKACAILSVSDIEQIDQEPKLEALSWPRPHYLHANIKPLPVDKALQRHIAHRLSEMASVKIRNH